MTFATASLSKLNSPSDIGDEVTISLQLSSSIDNNGFIERFIYLSYPNASFIPHPSPRVQITNNVTASIQTSSFIILYIWVPNVGVYYYSSNAT